MVDHEGLIGGIIRSSPLCVNCSLQYSEGNLGHLPGYVCRDSRDTTSHQKSAHDLSLFMRSINHSSGRVVALVLLEYLFVVSLSVLSLVSAAVIPESHIEVLRPLMPASRPGAGSQSNSGSFDTIELY